MQCSFNLTCYKYFSIGGTNTPILFTHNLEHSSAVGKFQYHRKGGDVANRQSASTLYHTAGTHFTISCYVGFSFVPGTNTIWLLKKHTSEQKPKEISKNSKMKRRVPKVGDRKEAMEFNLINDTAYFVCQRDNDTT